MTTDILPSSRRGARAFERADMTSLSLTRYLVPLGRLLFVLIFLQAVPNHFTAGGIEYAAAAGVPMPNVLVPLSGILALVGGISVLLGYHARWGALSLVVFLVPVTLSMHAFWNVPDPQMAQMQMVSFMKNVSILGGALLLMHFGPGPLSVDRVRGRARGR